MHAVFIDVTFKDTDAALGELDTLVPQTSGMPGFVAGYWVAVGADNGKALVVFESEEQAAALAQVASADSPAVTNNSIEVGEVHASA